MDRDVDRTEPSRPTQAQSTAELVQHATEQITRLVREELALARAELSEKGRHAGIGAGLLGGAGLLALYGVGVLLVVAVLALDEVMPAWLAALIVAVVLLLIAGGMALLGRQQVRQAVPPTPEQTAQSVRDDLDAMAHAVRDRDTASTSAGLPAAAEPMRRPAATEPMRSSREPIGPNGRGAAARQDVWTGGRR